MRSATAGDGALLLLFPRGERPELDVLREVVAGTDRLTLTGTLGDGEGADSFGVEVLRDGMTYDLVGVSPGPPIGMPSFRHRLGVPKDFSERQSEALALRPGPHLAAGARTIPVVRTMMGVAAMIAPHLPGLRALAWPAAGTLIGPDFFVSSMITWIAGGAFPALGLTAFAADPDAGLRSEGLAFFTGQELRLDPVLADDRAAGTQLGIRLVDQLVGQGRLTAKEAIIGPEGERLTLEPSAGGRLVYVSRG
jgi:hypothetical protein